MSIATRLIRPALRTALLAGAALFFSGLAAPAEAQAACGGLNQRACNIWERIPSCNIWLIETVESCGTFCVRTMCRDNGCGGTNERACVPFIDHAFSNVCQSGRTNVLGTCRVLDQYGFPSWCGHDGQDACNVAIQTTLGIPSCIPNHFEEGFPSGTCRQLDPDGYPLFCGGELELACDLSLQAQLFILPCKWGLENNGVCMEPLDLSGATTSWPAEEHAPTGILDAERAVFVIHGMISSRHGNQDTHVQTLLQAGHRVFTVDYAASNAPTAQEALTIDELFYDVGTGTTTSTRAYTSTASFHSLRLPLEGVAAALAVGIDVLVPDGNVALVGHSMGGLVSRALVESQYDWLRNRGVRITEVVTIGSPHTGSNLDLGTWADTYLPPSEVNWLIGLLGNAAVGAVSCTGFPILMTALNITSLEDTGLAIWPGAMFQNCQMEGFHLAVSTSAKTLDNLDFPHIRWGGVAGTNGGNLDDGAVPVASAHGIAFDEIALVDGHHSSSPSILQAAGTQDLLRSVIGVASDPNTFACSNGFDDDGDGLEDLADPDCANAHGVSEQPGSGSANRCGSVSPEMALVFPVVVAGRLRRRLGRRR